MPESWAAEPAAALRRRAAAPPSGGTSVGWRARQLAAQAPDLVAQIETLAGGRGLRRDSRRSGTALRKQWQHIARDAEIDAGARRPLRPGGAAASRRARTSIARAAPRAQQDNLHRLQASVQELETRAAAENLSLKDAERILKDTKLVVGTMGPLPTKQDRDDLTVRLQAVRTAVTPRIKELRDAEEWKRWANVQVQEELCTKMEALIPLADSRARKGRDRDARAAGALEGRRRRAALAGRNAVDALQGRAGSGLREVQGLLRAAGRRAPGEPEEEGSARARAPKRWPIRPTGCGPPKPSSSCRPSGRRSAPSRAVTKSRCGSASAAPATGSSRAGRTISRSASTSGRTTSRRRKRSSPRPSSSRSRPSGTRPPARIKQLQVEWKKIGPVRKNKSEVVWQRFRAACDTFFERFKTRDQVAVAGKLADRETAVAELEALVPPADAAETRGARGSLRARCRRRARAICRGRSCRGTRWRRSPIA